MPNMTINSTSVCGKCGRGLLDQEGPIGQCKYCGSILCEVCYKEICDKPYSPSLCATSLRRSRLASRPPRPSHTPGIYPGWREGRSHRFGSGRDGGPCSATTLATLQPGVIA